MPQSLIGLLSIALAIGACGRAPARLGSGEGESEAEAEAEAEAEGNADMVEVPEGAFWMGCNLPRIGDCENSEHPYHEVALSAYRIDRTEVTVAAYAACVEAGPCPTPDVHDMCNWGHADRLEYPVNCVTWEAADEYCAWMGKRLPTEAEWEKAARGTDERLYPWGNGAPTCYHANYGQCSEDTTRRVGTCTEGASPYGALDMAGNVWEWVADWWDERYYASSPGTDPPGPDTGSMKGVRGGSYLDDVWFLVTLRRAHISPTRAVINVGFRCAADP